MVANRCFVTLFAVISSHCLRSFFLFLVLCPLTPKFIALALQKERDPWWNPSPLLNLPDRSGRFSALTNPVLAGKSLILLCAIFCGNSVIQSLTQLTVLAAQLPYLDFQFQNCLQCFGVSCQKRFVLHIHTIPACSPLLPALQPLRQSDPRPAETQSSGSCCKAYLTPAVYRWMHSPVLPARSH